MAPSSVPGLPPKPASGVWELPDMRAAVAVRNIGAVYAILRSIGHTQQQIAALSGHSQPEVAAILAGRMVVAHDVLVRIARGLGMPFCLAGLAPCCRPPDSR